MSKTAGFFASDRLMLISFLIALVMYGTEAYLYNTSVPYTTETVFIMICSLVLFLLVIFMYRAFYNHDTGAMNILTGVSLGVLLITGIQLAVLSFGESMYVFSPVICIISAVLTALFVINHTRINSMHKSTRGRVLFGQILLFVITAYQIFMIISVSVSSAADAQSASLTALCVTDCVAKIFTFFMIVCSEAKLNAYKAERGAAMAEGTWTEEKKAETKEKYFGD